MLFKMRQLRGLECILGGELLRSWTKPTKIVLQEQKSSIGQGKQLKMDEILEVEMLNHIFEGFDLWP